VSEVYRETIAAREERWIKNFRNPALKPESDSNKNFLNDPEITLVPKIINKPNLPPIPFLPKRLNKPPVQSKQFVELNSNTDFLNDPKVTLVPKIINKPTLQLTPIAINPLTPLVIPSLIEDNNPVNPEKFRLLLLLWKNSFIF
jgi:hypothetical protein